MRDRRDIDPELRGTDRLFAVAAVTDERLGRIEDAITDLGKAIRDGKADHEDRITELERTHAEQRGAMSVLLWAVPGGPAVIAVVAYVLTR